MPSFFALDQPAHEKRPLFRVTTYTISSASGWSGLTYSLNLDFAMEANYFVLLFPSATTTGTAGPGAMAARVESDPFGTGDLTASGGSRVLGLIRGASTSDWVGSIVVVECLDPAHASGFTLAGVKNITLTASSGAGIHENSVASGLASFSQVTPIGGVWGGGLSTSETLADRWPTALSRITLDSGDFTIRWRRHDPSALVKAATGCCYLVRWGSDWSLQSVALVPGAPYGGAGLDVAGEFATAAITAVTRAKAMMLSSFTGNGTTTAGQWVLCALGNGITESAVESLVAAGSWTASTFEAQFWVLSHSSLSVDWTRIASSSVWDPQSVTVPEPKGEEGFRATSVPRMTWGRRMPLVTTGSEAAAAGDATEALLWPIVAGSSLELWRWDSAGDNIVAWAQMVDFANVTADYSAADIGYPGPVQGLILPDLEMSAETISSITSRNGYRLGRVSPDPGNVGKMFGFHAGDPTADLSLTYRLVRHGDLADSGWAWQDTDAAYWYGWNAYNFLHGSHVVNAQTTSRYGFVAAFSSVYDRAVVGYFNSSTSTALNVYYLPSDGEPFDYTSLGSLEFANTYTTPTDGLDALLRMIEIDDGTLLIAVLVEDENVLWDFDVYSSIDGGDTWTQIATRIVWRARGTALSVRPRSMALAASGDWVRLVFVDATAFTVLTAVSSTRGSSWEYLGADTSPILTGSNGFASDPYPIAIAGRPDGAGTFLMWVRDSANNYEADGYTAARGEDWVPDSDLSYSTGSGHAIEHLAATSGADGVFCAVQVWRSSLGQVSIRLRLYDPEDLAVTVLGTNAAMTGPGWDVRPYQLHLLDGRRELLIGWNALTAAGAALEGMILARMGGWSQVPVQGTLPSGAVDLQTWSSLWAPSPSTGVGARWPRTLTGATVTPTRDNMNVLSAAGQNAYWEFSPASSGSWVSAAPGRGMSAGALVRVKQAAGNVSDRNIGIKVKAVGGGPTCVSFMVTATTTAFHLWDLLSGAGTQIAYIAAPGITQSLWEVRAGLISNFSVFMAARQVEDVTTWKGRGDGWTRVSGSLVGAAGLTLDMLQVGHQTHSGSGSNESEWREIWVSDSYGNNAQRASMTWSDFSGRRTATKPQRVYAGVDVFWGGSGGARRDTFTGDVAAAYPAEAIFVDSPSVYWQGADDSVQRLVMDFGLSTAGDSWATGRRSLHEAALLVGTRSRTATIEYDSTGTFTAPAATFELDATIWSGLRVLSTDGQAALVEYSGQPDSAGSLAGAYLRITAGATSAAVGKTFRIRKHGHPTQEAGVNRAWLYLESEENTGTLVSYGIAAGDTACAFADRMALVYGQTVKSRYMRITLPDEQAAPNGKHAIGAIVAGPFHQFDPPLDWTWKDNEQPNTTRFASKSGITWAKKEGPPQRTFQGRLVGDTASQLNRPAYRDLLKLFADYDRRPVGLLMQIDTSGVAPPSRALYGYVSTGGQLDNEGQQQDSRGLWQPAGDVAVELVEVK